MEYISDLVSLAMKIARQAHDGQVDKAGEPYINHPIAVASQFVSEELIVAGLLHDVLEDTSVTRDDLLAAGIPPGVVDIVQTLTRRPDETYFDYIRRVSRDRSASTVKLADLKHNLSRNQNIVGERLRRRYQKAYYIILGELMVGQFAGEMKLVGATDGSYTATFENEGGVL